MSGSVLVEKRLNECEEDESPAKKLKVELSAEETRWSDLSEELTSGVGLDCLLSDEVLEDDESSATNDAASGAGVVVPASLIYSVPKPTAAATSAEEESEAEVALSPFAYVLPRAEEFEPLVRQVVAAHGSLPPPEQSWRPTLVLDLDETLVHSTVAPHDPDQADFSFPVNLEGSSFVVHCSVRPHCREFLRRCQAMGWELAIFTASKSAYADAVLDLLDPSGELLRGSHRLYREHCIEYRGNFLKHLGVTQRDLRRTVIVDNSPAAFALQQENGIAVESWFDDANDCELLKLLDVLQVLRDQPDFRRVLRPQ